MRLPRVRRVFSTSVLVSAQHSEDVTRSRVRDGIAEEVVEPVLATPPVDTLGLHDRLVGLTGAVELRRVPFPENALPPCRAIPPHDAARWVAKHIAAVGLAERCGAQIACAVGVAEPVSITVEIFGTESRGADVIERMVGARFDLRPVATVKSARPAETDLRRHGGIRSLRPRAVRLSWEDTTPAAGLAGE